MGRKLRDNTKITSQGEIVDIRGRPKIAMGYPRKKKKAIRSQWRDMW